MDGHCLGVQAREARFEGVAGGDLRDETLLTAACQELRAAPSKIGSSLPDEYSVAGIVLPTVNFMILAGQYPEEVPLAGVFWQSFCPVFNIALEICICRAARRGSYRSCG